MHEITFPSGDDICSAWHLPAEGAAFTRRGTRPCLVMAPGFGGTRDSGLLVYAEAFAAAGIDVLLFDYRGFGASGGSPRQLVSVRGQRDDYHAALAAARALPGVDPTRVVLWGVSYAGGHVLAVAAKDPQVAAVISMTPAADGLAALAQLLRTSGPLQLLRAAAHGLRDATRAATGRPPHLVPMIGEPGSQAVIAKAGGIAAYREFAGPSWRNEVCARAALEVAFNRPVTAASRVTCPLLVQVGTKDSIAPPRSGRRAVHAAGARAELCEYPIDHLDVYLGPWQDKALADQLDLLQRVL